jgi:hypothetical protein
MTDREVALILAAVLIILAYRMGRFFDKRE